MATTTTTTRSDIYTRVTSRIVDELERGVCPWMKPWTAEHAAGRITRPLRHNGQAYRGIYFIQLWMTAETAGFISPFWLTFQQARELGGHVKKGEHGTPVVYASTFKKKEENEQGEEIEQEVAFLKEYTVDIPTFGGRECWLHAASSNSSGERYPRAECRRFLL